jgi:hypothetical protein
MMGIAALLSLFKAGHWAIWLYGNRAWLRWVAVGVTLAALLGLWRWERHDRLLAEQSERMARAALQMAGDDVARWQAAAAQRDRALAARDAALAIQSAAIERLRAYAAKAAAAARRTALENSAAAQAAAARLRELEEEAHARPEDVRDLGPIVLRGAAGLFD